MSTDNIGSWFDFRRAMAPKFTQPELAILRRAISHLSRSGYSVEVVKESIRAGEDLYVNGLGPRCWEVIRTAFSKEQSNG